MLAQNHNQYKGPLSYKKQNARRENDKASFGGESQINLKLASNCIILLFRSLSF